MKKHIQGPHDLRMRGMSTLTAMHPVSAMEHTISQNDFLYLSGISHTSDSNAWKITVDRRPRRAVVIGYLWPEQCCYYPTTRSRDNYLTSLCPSA